MAEAPSTLPDPRLFVGVGIDAYDQFPALEVEAQVGKVGALLEKGGYRTALITEGVTDAAAEAGLKEHLRTGALKQGALVVLWAGHGEPRGRDLRLITKDAPPNAGMSRTARQVADMAHATAASQILLLLDTCYSGAALPAMSEVIADLRAAFPNPQGWVGVLASARAFEPARQGALHAALVRVLTEGPRDPTLRRRFFAFNAGVRGDDVMDVIKQEWDEPGQRPDDFQCGRAGSMVPLSMFPNPLWDPQAPEDVVEHLLLAAHGRAPSEAGRYFTGRTRPLQRIVDWLNQGEPGVFVVTGLAGCGKSAVAGRIVSLSNPAERRELGAEAAPGPDPGEHRIHAHAYVRRLKLDELARTLDRQLQDRGVLPRTVPARSALELRGAIERQHAAGTLTATLAVVIDGLDEAETEAKAIANDLVQPLARYAQVLVASRAIETEEGSLLEKLGPAELVDLSAPEWAEETREDLRGYVQKRLGSATGVNMNAAAIAEHLLTLSRAEGEGAFLLARVVTSQLLAAPVDTSRPGWEAQLAKTVEAALDRDLDAVPGKAPCGVPGPVAARELLTALAWGYGNGVPDDVWAAIASALPGAAGEYKRDDVYWVLGVAGRYVIAARGRGQAVYRLAHQRLAQHLRPERLPLETLETDPATLPVARAVVRLYEGLLEGGADPKAFEYLWQHAWLHCVDAGSPGLEVLRGFAQARPALNPCLMMALINLGASVSNLGRWEEARGHAQEAVDTYRQLSKTNPAFVPHLALALNNLSVHLSGLGRDDEALAPIEESVDTCRQLSKTNPAFVADLARALVTLGVRLAELGRRDEALVLTQEAVDTYRSLCTANPAFRPNLAMALDNLGNRLSVVRRHDEALVLTQEAVDTYRILCNSNPAFRPDLARALNNLGLRLSELARPEEALGPTQEAADTYGQLSKTNPTFLPNLAVALINLGSLNSNQRRVERAVAATEESVDVLRNLSQTNRVHIPKLAGALHNLGMFCCELGRPEEALEVWQEVFAELPPDSQTELQKMLAGKQSA